MTYMQMDSGMAFTAVSLCVLIAGSMVMLVGGASPNARHTVAGAALVSLALGWGLLMGAGDALRTGIVLADEGISLALVGVGTLLSIMMVADRSRVAGLVFFTLMVNAVGVHYVHPLLEDTLPLQSLAASLYNVLILSTAAGFVLLYRTPRSGERFTAQGEYRVTFSPSFSKDIWAGGLLALGMSLLILRLRDAEGADTGFLMQACIVGAVVAAFGAFLTTAIRKQPSAVNNAFLALPAGVLAVGLAGEMPMPELCALAAIAGILVSVCRDALVRLRLDEPSQSIASLCVPAMVGLMVPALTDASLFVSQAAWVGALAVSGVVLGYISRLLVQATLGLAPSRRAREEGLDMRYAMQGA